MQRSEDTVERHTEIDDSDATTTAPTDATGSRIPSGMFSLKVLLLSVVLVIVGVVAGGAIPLVGSVGSLAGVFLATFLVGLIASKRRYLETALAGGGVVGAFFGVSLLTTGVLPVGWHFFQQYGLAFGALGVGLGALLAVVGHYFGRDLRTGLTREV